MSEKQDIVNNNRLGISDKTTDRESSPNIKYVLIPDVKKDRLRICLVQLDFLITKKFPYQLKEKEKVKKKILNALKVAKKNEVDIICFPELSFTRKFAKDVKKEYKDTDMIIIGGSFYEDNFNKCPVIIKGKEHPVYKIHPSPHFETDIAPGKGMKSGKDKDIKIFGTKDDKFRFGVLICIDFLEESPRLSRYERNGKEGVNFIFNPSFNPNTERFQRYADSYCENKPVDLMQANVKEYGGTCIIGSEHKKTIERLINEKYRQDDGIKYKLCEVNGEMMIIVDLSLEGIEVPTRLGAKSRIKIMGRHIYKNGDWKGYEGETFKDEKPETKLEEFYEVLWEKSSSLQHNKILMVRPFHQYYYSREGDEKIKEAIDTKENILVIGRPLSGKTRAIYEALINTPDCDVTIPKCGENFTIVLPQHHDSQRRNIIFFDDLNYFAEKDYFNKYLFSELENNKIIIVASCRSKRVYEDTENDLLSKGVDPSVVFSKNIIELPDISDKEGKDIAAYVGRDWDEIEFDHTVGSIFMPLSEMKKRFRECDKNEKSILRTMCLLYRCGFYKEKQIFPLEWIKIVCDKKYGLRGEELEWDEWLGKLSSKEFIKLEKDKRTWAEEVYLERIFKLDSEISPLHLFREMIDYFSESPDAFFESPDVLFRFANNAYYVIGIADNKKIKLYKMAKEIGERAIEKTTKGSIEYAHFQKLLGITYRVLSEMVEEDRDINAKKAIKACKEACDTYESKKDFLQDYAISQSDLGTAYRRYAKINKENEKKREYCRKSIYACKKALEIEKYPEKYRATTFNILGATHRILAEVENRTENCKKAIEYCMKALEIYTKENLPTQVAVTQYVIGGVYKLLAGVENKTENCKIAIKYFEKALKVRTLTDFEIDYAWTQINLGDTCITFAEVENKAENCEKAIEAYEEALKVFTKEKYPESYQMIKSKIGRANELKK